MIAFALEMRNPSGKPHVIRDERNKVDGLMVHGQADPATLAPGDMHVIMDAEPLVIIIRNQEA